MLINERETRSGQRGFTLIELLVVIVIIGLLASLVGPRLFGKVEKSKRETARAQIEMFATALDSYRLDVGRYPDKLEELIRSSQAKWDGPYLRKNKIPPDPWGEEYQYQVQDGGKNYRLSSKGGEGEPINSWE
jgi:general secretion pathway protein G